MKNMMDFCIGTPAFWLVGFGLMFGGSGAFIGKLDPLIRGSYQFGSLPTWCFVIFQTVFCATSATIVSGSMAERTNFKAYCLYSAMISLIVYPISGHWIWGGGWLSQLGFHDFAGSTAVHMVGGVTARIGAKILWSLVSENMIKTENQKQSPVIISPLPHSVFSFLWFCWFGFNGASTTAMSTDADLTKASLVYMNTNLAAAIATCTAMIFTWVRYGKPDVSMTLNGALAGLVAITAGCDQVSPVGAFFIGLFAGILLCVSVDFFDRIAKLMIRSVPFPYTVPGVPWEHSVLVCSQQTAVCFMAEVSIISLIQLLGVASVMLWVIITMTIIFKVIDKLVGLRVPADIEIEGLDYHEHGLASAYAGFNISILLLRWMWNENTDLGESDYAESKAIHRKMLPVKVAGEELVAANPTGMYKVSILVNFPGMTNSAKLTELGATGMTVTQVMGCGYPERFRAKIPWCRS